METVNNQKYDYCEGAYMKWLPTIYTRVDFSDKKFGVSRTYTKIWLLLQVSGLYQSDADSRSIVVLVFFGDGVRVHFVA